MNVAHEKQLVAEAAAQLVENGMIVGLGTGSTVAYLLPALAVRGLDLRCVATSPATEHLARELGITVEPFRGATGLARLDVAIDGADQVAPSGWLVGGGGPPPTRGRGGARRPQGVSSCSSPQTGGWSGGPPPSRSSCSSSASPPR